MAGKKKEFQKLFLGHCICMFTPFLYFIFRNRNFIANKTSNDGGKPSTYLLPFALPMTSAPKVSMLMVTIYINFMYLFKHASQYISPL